jgi:hypothetical protein
MESSDIINDENSTNQPLKQEKTDTSNANTSSSIGSIPDSDLPHSDTEDYEDEDDGSSHTEGKPSPPINATNSLQPATLAQRHSPSTDTDRSTSPTRSKKRAIDTMLDGEEDKECIVMEKPPPHLPKRSTPPSPPLKSKISSSTSQPTNLIPFIDGPLYKEGDLNYDQACQLFESFRQHDGILENRSPILKFFDEWIKEVHPNSINVVDALFKLLLDNYDPTLDEQLVARIPLVMNQILQRKLVSVLLVWLILGAKRLSPNYFVSRISQFNSL